MDKELGGFPSHEEIDMALANGSQATFEQYVPYYAVNEKYQDALAPFKTPYQFTNSSSPGGLITLPANYRRLNSIWLLRYDNDTLANVLKEVPEVNDDDLAERTRSQLDPISTNPIFQAAGAGKFQLYPKKQSVGECWYLKTPADPVFAYTQVGRIITYDQANSTQLEWSRGELNNVMFRALQYLGVNMSQELMVQYTQLKLQDA